MNYWVLTYLVLYVALCIGSIALDLHKRQPVWFLVGDSLAALFCIVISFIYKGLAVQLGYFLWIIVTISLLWEIYSGYHDVKAEFPDAE